MANVNSLSLCIGLRLRRDICQMPWKRCVESSLIQPGRSLKGHLSWQNTHIRFALVFTSCPSKKDFLCLNLLFVYPQKGTQIWPSHDGIWSQVNLVQLGNISANADPSARNMAFTFPAMRISKRPWETWMDDWMTGKKIERLAKLGVLPKLVGAGSSSVFQKFRDWWHGNFLWAKKILSLEGKVVIYIYVTTYNNYIYLSKVPIYKRAIDSPVDILYVVHLFVEMSLGARHLSS